MAGPRDGRSGVAAITLLLWAAMSCTGDSTPPRSVSPTVATAVSAEPSPVDSRVHVLVGEPIDTGSLTGRIVLSTEDNVYSANADGSGLEQITRRQGPEFDPAWAPDGDRIVYRDSRRGINHDDEIFIVDADGSKARNLTNDPANDWGPDWSADGRTIVFNSDRDGMPMSGYLVDPDGSHLRRIPADVWIEYPTWSPDGTRIAFMGGGPTPSEYDIWVVDVDGSNLVQLTDFSGCRPATTPAIRPLRRSR